MSDETLHTIARYPNLCRHIHLPVQSGNNRILSLMNRKYTREWYLDRIVPPYAAYCPIAAFRAICLPVSLESEEEFAETLSLMREVEFDSSFLFKYSERPGTYAARHLPDNIAEEVKIERLQRMIDLQNELSQSNAGTSGTRSRSPRRRFLPAVLVNSCADVPTKTKWWYSPCRRW